MATTAILRSRDYQHHHPHPLRNPNPNPRSHHRRRPSNRHAPSCPPQSKLVMGQVQILKRGEESKARLLFGRHNFELCSTDPLGPDPLVVEKQIRVPDLYAGPTMVSPPPSSLPFPTSLIASPRNRV